MIQKDHVFKAVIYCIAAHFLFAVMGFCAKFLADTHHVAEIAFYRNIMILVPLTAFIFIARKTHLFKTNKPKTIALRSTIGGFGMMITFAALAALPMSYATVIFYTSSILTPVLAFFFLKEHIGIHRWSAVGIGMIGVIIVAQPTGAVSIIGLILAIATACIHGVMFTLLRSLKTESSITVTFYFILGGTIIPALFLPWVGQAFIMDEIWIFAILGLSGGIAQFCLANAYKYAPAAVVTPFAYSSLIWSISFDILFFQYKMDFIALFTGFAMICGAQLYIIYREYINGRRTE